MELPAAKPNGINLTSCESGLLWWKKKTPIKNTVDLQDIVELWLYYSHHIRVMMVYCYYPKGLLRCFICLITQVSGLLGLMDSLS